MIIIYRDNLGYVSENVDEFGISANDGIIYFNDKQIPIMSLVEIKENTDNTKI